MRQHDLARLVSLPLRVGTVLAVLVIGLGLVLALGDGAGTGDQGAPLLETLGDGGPAAIISIGLLLLTLIPLGVTIGAVAGFARTRERRYLLASVVVAVLLIASLAVPAFLLADPV